MKDESQPAHTEPRAPSGAESQQGTSRIEAAVALPRDLLSRVRWIFLLFGLLMAVLHVPMIVRADVGGWPLRVLAISGLV